MTEIHRVLKKAAWRVGVINFLRGWVYAAAVILTLAIVLRFAEQVLAFTDVAPAASAAPVVVSDRLSSAVMWEQFAYFGAGASVVFALVWAVAVRPRTGAVARRVDEGANLREALSTALCVAKQDDPWARATVQSAERTARGVNVKEAVPITAPRLWPVVVALGLSLAVVYMAMPRLDVLGWFASAKAEQKQKADVINAVQEVKAVEKKIEELTSKIPSLEKEQAAESPAAEKPDPKTAEEIRKAAIANLTKLTDRLEQLQNSAGAKKLEAMQGQLKNLKQIPGEAGELSKSLAKGDFSQAKQELEKMKDQMAGGEMSAEAKEKMAEAMAKMAEQMEKLAQNQEQVKKALENAGINPESIKDQASAREAIKNAQNLSEEQKQAMQQMLDAAMQSSEGMEQMAQAMQKMSEGMKQQSGEQGQQQAQEAAQQLAQQMSEMEQMQQEMDAAEATMNECQQAMAQLGQQEGSEGMGECQGGLGNQGGMKGNESTRPWSAGISSESGEGRGGPGLGQGGRPGESPADFEMEKKKFLGAKGDGPIVSSRLVEGDSIRGESRADFVKAVAAGDQASTEAIENNTIPREYHDAIKSYFGRLKGKAQKSADGASKPSEPAAPAAEPAKDAGGK